MRGRIVNLSYLGPLVARFQVTQLGYHSIERRTSMRHA
jgi:hypothetical protein